MNKATGPYSAIVNGTPTSLAGCPRTDCRLPCLRKDPLLEKAERQGYRLINGDWQPIPWRECGAYITADYD
jgi:hypothetical protein